jgi:hypothetical protein
MLAKGQRLNLQPDKVKDFETFTQQCMHPWDPILANNNFAETSLSIAS